MFMKHIHVVEALSCITLSLLGFITYNVYQLVPQITTTLGNINDVLTIADDFNEVLDTAHDFIVSVDDILDSVDDILDSVDDIFYSIENVTDSVQELKDLYTYKNVEFYYNGSTPEYR
jgi:hypothetical protein